MGTPSPTSPQADQAIGETKSPNFHFLAIHHLVRYALQAERYLFDDPSTAILKLRQFTELLAQQACANVGISTSLADDLVKSAGSAS